MNDRRDLLIVLGAFAFASRAVLAQSKQAPVMIGWLSSGSRESHGHYLSLFKEGLVALGWKEGSQVVFEERWANNQVDRMPVLAEDLATKRPAVIVTTGVGTTGIAAMAAPRTPVVMAMGGNLVAAGLAASLARPGGMITGLTNIDSDLSEKFLELLLAASPKSRRIGFLADPFVANHTLHMENARRSVAQHGVEARFAEATKPEEIDLALSRFAKEGAQGLVVIASGRFFAERRGIVKFALAQRWPLIGAYREFADEGALLSYSPDNAPLLRRPPGMWTRY